MTEKIYLKNPYLRQLDARITEKKYINSKYYIKLDKTIFYPNLAGGQPGDFGTINGVQVIDTYEENNHIIHVTEENIHSEKVALNIDWDNRFDYMQQHSGQHLLSSVFYKLFNAETLGFYMGKEHVYIDLDLPCLSKDGLYRAENFANKIIFSNFPIKSYTIKKDELKNINLYGEANTTSAIRIIEIDEIDFTPCCGTHLRNTGEIGLIKLLDSKRTKKGIRIEFVCGSRALADYQFKNHYLGLLSSLLNCEIGKLKDDIKSLLEEKNTFQDRFYEEKANNLMNKKDVYKGISFIYEDLDDLSLEDLTSICNYILKEDNYAIFFNLNQLSVIGASPNLNIGSSLKKLPCNRVKSDYPIFTMDYQSDKEATYMKIFFNNIIKKL